MIAGKTVKTFEVVNGNSSINSEILMTFSDGTKLQIIADGEVNCYKGDEESGRSAWVHPENLK